MEDSSGSRRYMDLLSLATPEEAYRQVKELASGLSDDEHLIRSCIFDLHAAVEFELRRIYYHVFKRMLFLTKDETQNATTLEKFEKAIERLSFMEMYRVLKPVLQSWPFPDLESIDAINDTRNKAAHNGGMAKILYKGRSPFLNPDAFAQIYFDVWAIRQAMVKFFEWTIEIPRERLRQYREKFGEL
jgi:hypothetical protein